MKKNKWEENDIERVLNLSTTHSPTEISNLTSIPRSTVRGIIERNNSVFISNTEETTQEWLQTKTELEDKLRISELELRNIRRENLTVEYIREQIFGLAKEVPNIPNWDIINAPSKINSAGIPFLKISDVHFSEVVNPIQVNGINEYNITITRDRVKRIVKNVINIATNHMVGTSYPGIVVSVEGDIAGGEIHPELKETNELPIYPSIVECHNLFIWVFEKLEEAFGKVFVSWVVGNHGRDSVKPIYKNRVERNADWLIGVMLENHFRNNDNIHFHVPSEIDSYFNIAGYRFLATHGDSLGTRGGDGIIGAVGPIIRGDVKVRKQQSSINREYDYLSIGHWHQEDQVRNILVNGSIIGFNEFAKIKLRVSPEPPKQALYFVHEDYGITCHWPIYASKVSDYKLRGKSRWVSWPE